MRGLLYTLAIFGLFFGIAAAEVSRGNQNADIDLTPKQYGPLPLPNPDIIPLSETYGPLMKPKIQLKPVPIDKILQKNAIHCANCPDMDIETRLRGIDDPERRKKEYQEFKERNQKFKSSIIYALTLKKTDLIKLLKQEFQTINEETKHIINIKNNFNSASPAYRLANFQLKTQISQDIVQRNKQYKKLKNTFNQILANLSDSEDIYLIEAKDHLFSWFNKSWYRDPTAAYWDKVSYVSLFNQKFEHLLTYNRMHEDVLKYSKINAPREKISDNNTAQLYQQLFDDYITDLSRIGRGFDITNPNLLRMLDDMQDKTLSLELN